jgi:tetratricopeptide (TPR) repeat protein
MTAGQTLNQQLSSDADDGESLADVVKGLRTSTGETQEVFAKRFYKSRTYITNTERGDLHAEEFVKDLIKQFPKHKNRIEDAYERSLRRHSRMLGHRQQTALQQRIESQITAGRFESARRAILRGLANAPDAHETYWLYNRLHVALAALGRDDTANEALGSAITCAVGAGLHEEETLSRDRLASRHQIVGDFEAAHSVLDAGLIRFPATPKLWLRKGKVHWYEETYSLAYAALTAALKHGATRHSVLHARGQVLAEWGSFDAALADIANYLTFTKARPADIASARSARAYVWGQRGDLEQALAEFDEIEPLNPRSAWLHYRRALCYVSGRDTESATHYLTQALKCDSPKLNPPRKRHAMALLSNYGIVVEPDGHP